MQFDSKLCSKCGVDKPLSEFTTKHDNSDGLQKWCRECHNTWRRERYAKDTETRRKTLDNAKRWQLENKDRKAEYAKRYREHNIEDLKVKNRAWRLGKYGLTPEMFNELLAQQENKCAICKTDEPGGRGWHVDHCHSSGRVRGILCGRCNQGIGQLNDDPILCRAAAEYLESADSPLVTE